jgi:hypothetical protein
MRWPMASKTAAMRERQMKFVQMLRGLVMWLVVAALCCAAGAQQAQKPMTNLDVTRMVAGGVPESVVISTIQSHPAKYDLSPTSLVKLHQAKVTEKELNAMIAANANQPAAVASSTPANGAAPPSAGATNGATSAAPASSAAPNAAASTPAAASDAAYRMPTVAIQHGGASQDLPMERTQLANSKTKPNSMSTLAADTTLGSAMQAGVNTTTSIAASHAGGNSGMAIGQAGGILNGAMARRKPKITYIWAVPGMVSQSVVPFATVSFDVNFAGAPGVTLDDFEPAIVKLTPAQNAFRLIGATEGSADAGSDPTADWQIYDGFVQDKVASTLKKLAPGHFQISPGSALLPGEYAVVLRPVSKGKKFSGADVARYQGEGIIFDSVWSFQISTDAQAH